MDWSSLFLSIKLASVTVLLLLPCSVLLARWLAFTQFTGHSVVQALLLLPLVLPPTVLGFYLLNGLGADSWLGQWLARFDISLVFNFSGLLLASIIFNLPFMVQPIQRGLESIPLNLLEAASVSGLSSRQIFWRVELPLAWPGILSAMILTFVHTLGEFGVVMMIGGNIPGQTKTIAIAIYDQVQAFRLVEANQMSFLLLLLSLMAVAMSFFASARFARFHRARTR